MVAQELTSQRPLPSGVSLARDETVLVSDRFKLSTTAFYLHTDLVLTNRRLYAVRPNTLFGLVPTGTTRANFPTENIAGVNAWTGFKFASFIIGLLAVLVGLSSLGIRSVGAVAVVLLVIGLLWIVGAPRQAIEVMNSGGGAIRFPVSVFERRRTLEFASEVSRALARAPANAPESAVRTDPAVDTRDASSALRHIASLRDQGLITPDEYAAKRSEILARL